jgi:hypothetical protein
LGEPELPHAESSAASDARAPIVLRFNRHIRESFLSACGPVNGEPGARCPAKSFRA